jgi:hypothetical protein
VRSVDEYVQEATTQMNQMANSIDGLPSAVKNNITLITRRSDIVSWIYREDPDRALTHLENIGKAAGRIVEYCDSRRHGDPRAVLASSIVDIATNCLPPVIDNGEVSVNTEQLLNEIERD